MFLLDRSTGVTTRVSVGSEGQQGDAQPSGVTISGDGRSIAFASAATTLVAGDTNGVRDIFVRDRGEQTTGGTG